MICHFYVLGNSHLSISFDMYSHIAGADVLNGVASCVEAGAKVISMSLGCDRCFSSTTDLFYQDVYDQNVLVIAAAGNSGDVRDHFPSGYPAVMSVASVQEGGGVGSSNYGILSGFSTRNNQTEIGKHQASLQEVTTLELVPSYKYTNSLHPSRFRISDDHSVELTWIPVAGPGSAVRSTVPGDNYATFSGTSVSCEMNQDLVHRPLLTHTSRVHNISFFTTTDGHSTYRRRRGFIVESLPCLHQQSDS